MGVVPVWPWEDVGVTRWAGTVGRRRANLWWSAFWEEVLTTMGVEELGVMALLVMLVGALLLLLGEVVRSRGAEPLFTGVTALGALGGGALTVIFSIVTPPLVTMGTSSSGEGVTGAVSVGAWNVLLALDMARRHCAAYISWAIFACFYS